MKRSIEIEKAFKELHSGIYDWGKQKLQESVNQGYVESAGGFKLHLNYHEEFLELKRWYNNLDSEFWDQYKLGKKIVKYFEEKEDSEKFNQVMNKPINRDAVYLYNLNRSKISNYAKKKSEYFKICLNNPSQSTAAHQTKAAMIKLFNIIIENNDIWKVRIANAPYDEILLEVKKGLENKYAKILEKCMIEEGNKWLNSGLFSMEADSEIGLSWGECH